MGWVLEKDLPEFGYKILTGPVACYFNDVSPIHCKEIQTLI